jgi:hypothetical protein
VSGGRFRFDPSGIEPSSDAQVTDARRIVRWAPPRVLDELTSGDLDEDPSVTADRSTIVWSSGRDGGLGSMDLWMATRTSPTSPFSEPVNLTVLNSPQREYSPEISPDGSTLYFSSDRNSSDDLFVSERSGTGWSTPTLVAELSTAVDEDELALTPDLLTIVFVRETFHRATRTSPAGPFGDVVTLPELMISPDATSPTLGDDGRVIYFHAGAERDLWVARWNGHAYDTPTPVEELNTPGRDADPFISGDESYMIYNCDEALCETTSE